MKKKEQEVHFSQEARTELLRELEIASSRAPEWVVEKLKKISLPEPSPGKTEGA